MLSASASLLRKKSGAGRTAKSLNRRPSTIAPSSQNATACLRPHFRAGNRLGVSLRQVQAHEAPRRYLRQVRCRSHALEVRRERLGHIELASPCSHVWFFKGLPSRIGHLLDISLRDLESVLYFEAYVVVEPGEAPVKDHEVIKDETKYRELDQQLGLTGFKAMMGAEAIKELLKRVDIDKACPRNCARR